MENSGITAESSRSERYVLEIERRGSWSKHEFSSDYFEVEYFKYENTQKRKRLDFKGNYNNFKKWARENQINYKLNKYILCKNL